MKSKKRRNHRYVDAEERLSQEDLTSVSLSIDGMTCQNCQNKIERKLQNTTGVLSANVSYSAGTAKVTYDANQISGQEIEAAIEQLHYRVRKGTDLQEPMTSRVVALLSIILLLYVLLQHFGLLNLLAPSRLADAKMGYGMLFVIGLITSVHCLAMCGGINLSQSLPKVGAPSTFVPAFLYNLGRVISYTGIGFILGLVGFLLGGGSSVGLPTMVQGLLKLVAGVFMVIMGINMLGLFPWLRRFTLRMPGFLARKIDAGKAQNKSPFLVGLLNGLMPCGPLQSMQIVALASGNPLVGALSMFLFSLGTVPLMLGFGSIVSALGKKFTSKVMTVGAVLVVVMGLAMLSQGGSLTGFVFSFGNEIQETATASNIPIVDGKQIVNSTLTSGRYPNITVQVGTPVQWTIDVPEGTINGCNNRMLIRDYGIEYSFQTGENVIEFTPTKVGTNRYSCWMGMIRGTITVVEENTPVDVSAPESAGNDSIDSSSAPQEPIPAKVRIPTENLAIAEIGTMDVGEVKDYAIQRVSITLTDEGYSPAILVVEAGTDVEWTIHNEATDTKNFTMRVPLYSTILDLITGENQLYLFPTEDYAFSNGDNTFYGYVKVVDDLNAVDMDTIRSEVAAYQTLIYPEERFAGVNGSASCH